jgi:hypothetical protein
MRYGFGIAMIMAGAMVLSGCSKNPDNAILARVNGSKITVGEFKNRVERLSSDRQQAIALDAKARQELLEEIVRSEVLVQEASRQKLDRVPEYKKQLEQLRKDLEFRYRESSRNTLINSLLQKELPTVVTPPTDDEVQEYFQTHRDEIRKVTGKDLTYKEALGRGLRNYVFQMKQQNNAQNYAKGLREKASVQFDAAALEALGKTASTSTAVPASTGAAPGKSSTGR